VRWDLPRSIRLPNLTFLASPIPNLRKGLNLKKWSLDPDHAHFGGFVMLEIGYAKVYLCTELEVSSFTRSKFMEGVSKFKNLAQDPDHTPFGGILSSIRWDMPRSIRKPNLTFLVLPVPNLQKGF